MLTYKKANTKSKILDESHEHSYKWGIYLSRKIPSKLAEYIINNYYCKKYDVVYRGDEWHPNKITSKTFLIYDIKDKDKLVLKRADNKSMATYSDILKFHLHDMRDDPIYNRIIKGPTQKKNYKKEEDEYNYKIDLINKTKFSFDTHKEITYQRVNEKWFNVNLKYGQLKTCVEILLYKNIKPSLLGLYVSKKSSIWESIYTFNYKSFIHSFGHRVIRPKINLSK